MVIDWRKVCSSHYSCFFSVDLAAVGNDIRRVFVHLVQQKDKSDVMKNVPFIYVFNGIPQHFKLSMCADQRVG